MLMHGCHGKLFDKQPMSPTEPEGLPYSKAKPAELGCRVSLNMENTMVRKLENQMETATLFRGLRRGCRICHSLAFTVGQDATNREFGKSAGVRLLLLAADVLTAPMPKSKPLNRVLLLSPSTLNHPCLSSQMGLHKALQTRKLAGRPSQV